MPGFVLITGHARHKSAGTHMAWIVVWNTGHAGHKSASTNIAWIVVWITGHAGHTSAGTRIAWIGLLGSPGMQLNEDFDDDDDFADVGSDGLQL